MEAGGKVGVPSPSDYGTLAAFTLPEYLEPPPKHFKYLQFFCVCVQAIAASTATTASTASVSATACLMTEPEESEEVEVKSSNPLGDQSPSV